MEEVLLENGGQPASDEPGAEQCTHVVRTVDGGRWQWYLVSTLQSGHSRDVCSMDGSDVLVRYVESESHLFSLFRSRVPNFSALKERI